jgi:hypothetical protein
VNNSEKKHMAINSTLYSKASSNPNTISIPLKQKMEHLPLLNIKPMNQFITPKVHLNAKRAVQFFNKTLVLVILLLIGTCQLHAQSISTAVGGNFLLKFPA